MCGGLRADTEDAAPWDGSGAGGGATAEDADVPPSALAIRGGRVRSGLMRQPRTVPGALIVGVETINGEGFL